MTLRPEQNTTRILLSTTSSLVDEYEGDKILLMHAWPENLTLQHRNQALNKKYFILSVKTDPPHWSSVKGFYKNNLFDISELK
jgi:hypothetical protein